ncbi:MAG: peptidoglycan DD-metalloendopeptidase family protein, partial [Gammaproteobacteria bacterium]|nr:peptidoglycan DD-metalloendopeptidase family protein [Gammaproteobacteria bacterium]
DQKLKLSGPARRSASTAPARPAGKSTTRESTPSASASKPAATTPASSRSKTPTSTDHNKWLWPTEGRVVSAFRANDPTRNGIEIGGKEGQPVRATASGEVVYSGSGLIGYGELIIVKHSERLLSAYAHNRKRLVAEGQRVKAGERIAEMGRNDRNKAILHFEIRLNGSPRNPLEYLPGR